MSKFLSVIRDKHALWYKAFLFLCSLVFIVYFLPKENEFNYNYANLHNKPWNYENLTAPFNFPITKTDAEFNAEKQSAFLDRKVFFDYNEITFKSKLVEFSEIKSQYKADAQKVLDSLFKRGIIERVDSVDFTANSVIQVRKNGLVEDKKYSDYFTLPEALMFAESFAENNKITPRDSFVNLISNYISQTVIFNQSLTQKSWEQDLSNILPVKNLILKGQSIINKGEILGDDKFLVLSSLQNEIANRQGGGQDYFLLITGQVIVAALSLCMLFLFLAFFRKNIFSQNSHVTFLAIIVCLFVFVASKVDASDKISLYFVPFALAPILIRAFFDTRTALFAHLNIVLLASFFATERFEFMFIQIVAGISAIFSIANMTRRSQLLLSAFIVFTVYALSFIALTFILENRSHDINLSDFGVFAVSSFMILLAFPLFFLFEKSFGFISDFTLVELSDTNSNQLLRDLATICPGTFQHTIQVASMAEEVIRKIGGNPLLIRAGAMYHDIGKMDNPKYFTENQVAGYNPHEELGYEESAQIIISHVIKGIEKAKANRIPEQIIDFIRTHHGTGLTRYFYKKYQLENEGKSLDDSAFRYPGPIPFSKETAVLMMADSVEAASRSLKSYDAVTIDELVDRIINSQIEEQQFLNADITFRDITNIKKIFKKRLMNIYHVRVEYPR